MALKMEGRQVPIAEVDALIDVVVAAQLKTNDTVHSQFEKSAVCHVSARQDLRPSVTHHQYRQDLDCEQEIYHLKRQIADLAMQFEQMLHFCGNKMQKVKASSQHDRSEISQMNMQERFELVKRTRDAWNQAMKERDALEVAQMNQKKLRSILSQQSLYIDTLHSLLAFSPVNDVRLALMTPLETYICLGMDWDDRRRTIESFRESKIQMAIKYLDQKIQGLDLEKPHFYWDTFEKFGKLYISRFVCVRFQGTMLKDAVRVFRNVTADQDKKVKKNVGHMPTRQTLECSPSKFVYQRILNRFKPPNHAKVYRIQSNALSFTDIQRSRAVVVNDYVDEDELIPYQALDAIRKDQSSALVISSHVDHNTGEPYLLSRRYTLVRYHLNTATIEEEMQTALMHDCVTMMREASDYICHQLGSKYMYVPETDDAVLRVSSPTAAESFGSEYLRSVLRA